MGEVIVTLNREAATALLKEARRDFENGAHELYATLDGQEHRRLLAMGIEYAADYVRDGRELEEVRLWVDRWEWLSDMFESLPIDQEAFEEVAA